MPDLQSRWSPDERELSRVLHLAVDDAVPARPAPTAGRPEPVPAGAGRRRWALAAVPAVAACLVAAVVVGVGLATRDERAPVADPSPAPVLQDPAVLVGTWSAEVVAQPDAEDLTLRVGADSFILSEAGCSVGYWTDTHPDGLLLLGRGVEARVGGDPCAVLGSRPWMTDVLRTAQFVVQDEDHVLLLDRAGDQVVALERRGSARPSEPTAGVAALPAGLVAPTREELLGSWYEEGVGVAGRSVRFDEETWTYSQSVPCNSRSEPYALSASGGLLTLRTPNDRLQGCGARLPAWLTPDVTRVGLDGEVLVLLDASGQQVARLDRGGETSTTLLDQVQGEWEAVGTRESPTVDGLWLRIEGEWLRHAFNAGCNTAGDELRLSGDGWVVGSRAAQAGGCEPAFEELLPGIVERVLLDGDQLVVIGLGGDETRRFERAAAGDTSLLDRAQGRWEQVEADGDDDAGLGLWLDVDGDTLTHAGNAFCNVDETGYRLSPSGLVEERLDAYSLHEGEVNCQPGGPRLVQGFVGGIALDGDDLLLLSPQDTLIARFERADP